ncbi:MAG: NAD-dependent epimerase/dehydratase family protein [Acidimicrobiia bacterium]
MARIAVTGAAGPVGRRLCALLAADPEVELVRAIDRRRVHLPDRVRGDPRRDRVEMCRVHLRDADLDALLDGIDVVCHLAGSDPLEDVPVDHDLVTASRLLDAMGRAGTGQLIARTSATVYGAWPDNPVPLTEAAELRPNAETPWVQVRVGLEERFREFACANPDVAVAWLRPSVTVADEGSDELGRVLAAARVVAPADGASPAQFVHVDDVVAAIDAVRRARAEGAFNVAPDGSVPAERIRALVGGAPRLPLPAWLARRLTAIGWRYQLAPTPPGFVPFVTHPWIVANDRLRSLGWEPSMTNEEAYVAGHAAAPWAQISPKRRQELALGAAAAVLVGGGVAATAAVRRSLR